ncbi:methyl-CpG-binding domain-containing protein 13 [Iris pallida]|uniref:Methyl-CpG-binding domain-containing protein 13 n=1 Tax=Iris pallida TaxID=29817 RepID=A0AAX6HZS1_IRIPA|nr:methyl-CpG-binding domain-containing protein 13 [Iris pallida]
MGAKRAGSSRRIDGIRRLLAELTAAERPPRAISAAERRPDWLPDDWRMDVRWRKDNERADRYFICPRSGKVFRSKPEVMRYLNPDSYPSSHPNSYPSSYMNSYLSIGNVENSLVPYFGGYTFGPSGGSKHLFAALEDYPLEWLPTGWMLEFGTWVNGISEANSYKCYFDPLTGSRFYSKEAVLQYLEAHKRYPTSNPKGCNNANMKESSNSNCLHNVLTRIDYSPSGLPHGWVKEIRISKPKSSQKIRRDSFYIDTVSGFAFRSNKDAIRYLENREICRLAFRLEESHLPKAKQSLAIAVRQPKLKENSAGRRRFSKKIVKSNKMIVAEISDPPHCPFLPSAYHASAESDDISKTTCSTLAIFEQLRDDGKLETESPGMTAFNSKGFPEHTVKKMELELANDKPSDAQLVDNKILDLDVSLRQFKMTKKKLQRKNHGRKGRPVLSSTGNKVTTVNADRSGASKRKAMKAITLPLRASKRLAGVEADPVSGFGNGEQPQRAKSSQPEEPQPTTAKDSDGPRPDEPQPTIAKDFVESRPDEPQPTMEKDSDLSCGFHQKGASPLEHPEILDAREPQVEQATKEQQVDPSVKLPLGGDSWLDPSIEFAVKTLTGDIPVLDDTAALQEFYLRQLRSVQKLLPPGQPASVPSDGTLMKDDRRPSSLDNGKESKKCRQKFN